MELTDQGEFTTEDRSLAGTLMEHGSNSPSGVLAWGSTPERIRRDAVRNAGTIVVVGMFMATFVFVGNIITDTAPRFSLLISVGIFSGFLVLSIVVFVLTIYDRPTRIVADETGIAFTSAKRGSISLQWSDIVFVLSTGWDQFEIYFTDREKYFVDLTGHRDGAKHQLIGLLCDRCGLQPVRSSQELHNLLDDRSGKAYLKSGFRLEVDLHRDGWVPRFEIEEQGRDGANQPAEA